MESDANLMRHYIAGYSALRELNDIYCVIKKDIKSYPQVSRFLENLKSEDVVKMLGGLSSLIGSILGDREYLMTEEAFEYYKGTEEFSRINFIGEFKEAFVSRYHYAFESSLEEIPRELTMYVLEEDVRYIMSFRLEVCL
jgi:hypothetical protein